MRIRDRFKQLTLWNKLGAVGAVASIVGLVVAVVFWASPRSNPGVVSAPPLIPDVGLTFHRPRSPQFRVRNLSDDIVREPRYQFLVYDLDLPGTDQPYLNLRIPVAALNDYVRPKSSLGPWGLTLLSERGSRVQLGHRLFGYAQVECPNCVEFRHYWLFFNVGKFGWFAEIPSAEYPLILERLAKIIHGAEPPLDAIDKIIPVAARVAVE